MLWRSLTSAIEYPTLGTTVRARTRRPQVSSSLTTASAARSGVNSEALAAK